MSAGYIGRVAGPARAPRRGIARRLLGCALALGATLATVAPASAQFSPGASGLGDPFFPSAGNGGYDVGHYDLDLRYRPSSGKLVAHARIEATAKQALSAFNLDFRGPEISSVTVDGAAAGFERTGRELTVAPASGIPADSAFAVEVDYRGRPQKLFDPDGSVEGWIRTDDGAFVVGEPQGSTTWFPGNDHPTDKATFTFEVTVPRGTEAVANGALVERRRAGRWVTWTWHADAPMATYLATATIGNFKLDRSPVAGLDSVVAIDPRERRASQRALEQTGKMVRLFRSLYGPYPFGQIGAIVDHAPRVGYALETQTRPIYDRAPDEAIVAHEIAHQWFGNSVSLRNWHDMWLNEGVATWSEWRWTQERGGLTTAEYFGRYMREPASSPVWEPPPGAIPGPEKLFAESVYVRGAMTVEALRRRVGNEAFYATLRGWAASRAYGTGTTSEFIALAESTSGQELGELFDRWLFQDGKPAGSERRAAGKRPRSPGVHLKPAARR